MTKIPLFTPPSDRLRLRTIDMHTGGEPLRIIAEGYLRAGGYTIRIP